MEEKIINQIKEIFIRIEYLEKLISNMQQNIILTWTILAVVVAILSITITILVKTWVNQRVDQDLKKIKEQLQKDLEDYIDKKQSVKYQFGECLVTKDEFEIGIDKIKREGLDFPNKLEIFPSKGNKILKYDAILETYGNNHKIKIKLYNFDVKTDGHLRWRLTEYL